MLTMLMLSARCISKAYTSEKYPWLVAAYRFHNKVNMHSDWDLVKLDLPARVFDAKQVATKGQHYIVHFSSRSSTDHTYVKSGNRKPFPSETLLEVTDGLLLRYYHLRRGG